MKFQCRKKLEMYDVDKVQYGRNIFPNGVEGGQVSSIGYILTPFWFGGFF
jgi:hypothetical protein